MPGVLVDEQAFALDPPSHGFPIDSFSTPVSCANPYTYIHAPVSQLQARSSYHQLAPSFSRTISVDSKDRERSHILSQISLLHNRSQSHASVAVPDALGFTANANGEPVKRGGMTTWVGGLGAEDPVAKIGSSEMGGHTSGAFVAPSLDASLFKNSQGMYCNGQEFEEPRVGSPYSSGTSLWAQSNGGSLVGSPTLPDAILALRKFLPSNLEDDEAWPAVDVFSCDEFRMFEFKVRLCMRGRSHDWTECPFAHPGEKARRRDPRRFHYSGTACPDFRKGNCKRGDACEYAHGVFECWLHPARYRTQPCKDGRNCKRRVCFFAHTSEQLRLLPAAAQAATRTGSHPSSPRSSFAQKLAQCVSYDGSPMRSGMGASADAMQTIDTGFEGQSTDRLYSCCNGANTSGYQLGCSLHGPPHNGLCSVASQLSSPTSTLRGYSLSSPPLSPPLSPPTSPPLSPGSPADWSSYVSCVAAATTHTHPLSQVSGMSQAGVLQLQVPTGTSIHSVPSQAGISVHRRHLDRLNSIPALPVRSPLRGPPQPESSLPSSHQSLPTCSTLASKQISNLIATLKHLEFAGAEPFWLPTQALQAGQLTARCPSGPSPLRHSSQSVPSTPRMFVGKEADGDFWGVDAINAEVSLERVESGRGLRAKIFENLVKGSQQDSLDEQDVGWVNDLVKEESDHK